MSDWRAPGRDERPDRTKQLFGLGVAVGLLVLGWLLFARGGDEHISSSGFSESGGGGGGAHGAPSPFSSERRAQTGLSFVRLPGTTTASPDAIAGAAPTPSAPAPQAPSSSSEAAAPPESSSVRADDADPAKLASLGVPTSEGALKAMVGTRGPLQALMGKVFGYPPAVRFLLNNKTIVDGLFAREAGKKACESSAALTSYMGNGADPHGVNQEIGMLKMIMQNPASAAEAVGSEFGKRVMACPSIEQMKQDPTGLVKAVSSNPALLGFISDPAAVSAITTNPEAAGLLSAAQSTMASSGMSAPGSGAAAP